MAVTPTLLTSGTSTSDPATTASVSPTSGRLLILIAITCRESDAITTTHQDVSGLGATWDLLQFLQYGSRRGIWFYRCESDGTGGTIEQDYVGPNPGSFAEHAWVLVELSGQVTGDNGANAVGTPVTGTAFDTALALATVGALSAGDAVLAAFGIESDGQAGALEAGWTELADLVGSNANIRQMLVGSDDTDVTASVSWTGTASAGGVAARIIAGTAGQAVTPAAVTVTASAGALTVTTGAVGITPDPVTVTAAAGTLAMAIGVELVGAGVTADPGTATITSTVGVTPAATTVTATPGTVTVSAASAGQDVTPAPVTVTAGAGSMALSLDAPLVGPTVTATPGSLAVTQGLTVSLTGAAVAVTPAAVTVSAGATDVVPGAVTVIASAGSLSLAVDVTPGPVTVSTTAGSVALAVDVPLAGAGVTVAPGLVSVVHGTVLEPDQVTVTTTAGTLTVTVGAGVFVAAVTATDTSVSAVSAGRTSVSTVVAAAESTATVTEV